MTAIQLAFTPTVSFGTITLIIWNGTTRLWGEVISTLDGPAPAAAGLQNRISMLPFLGILPSTNSSMLPSIAKALGPASIGGGAYGGRIVCPPGTDALDKMTDVGEALSAGTGMDAKIDKRIHRPRQSCRFDSLDRRWLRQLRVQQTL